MSVSPNGYGGEVTLGRDDTMAGVAGRRGLRRVCRDGLLGGVVATACVAGGPPLASAAPRDVPIAIESGTVTATLDQVPLQAVLATLQQHTGMRYVLPPTEAARPVSARLHAVPLVAALREMFA